MSKHLVRLFTNLVFWLSEMAEEIRTDERYVQCVVLRVYTQKEKRKS